MARLSDEDIESRLQGLDGWERHGNTIHAVFKFGDFSGSIDFVNRLTPVANEMNHHPDLHISWDTVRVHLLSHSEGGVTENDFELAKKLSDLA